MAELIVAVELLQAPTDSYFLSYSDIHEVLDVKLNLQPRDLEGLQPGHRRYAIALKSVNVWRDKNIDIYLNRRLNLSSGKVVELNRAYEATTTVRAVRMPMSWNEEKVKRIFSYYGDVKKLEKEEWRVGNDNKLVEYAAAGLWNGNWRVKMIIGENTPIPSTLSASGERFEIYYQGQERTCWKCGGPHAKRDCRTPWGRYSNMFEYEDFPELPTEHETDAAPPEDESGDEMEDEQHHEETEDLTDEQVIANHQENKEQVIADNDQNKQVNAHLDHNYNKVNDNEVDSNEIVQVQETVQEIIDNTVEVEKVSKSSNDTNSSVMSGSLAIIAKAQEKIATAKDMDVRETVASTSQSQKNVTVNVEVHQESSQVQQQEETASASEGEVMEQDPAKQSKSLRDEFTEGFWTLVGNHGKRKAKQSSDEESEGVIKMGTGGFVNSFFNASKKKKDEAASDKRNEKKDNGESHSKQQALG